MAALLDLFESYALAAFDAALLLDEGLRVRAASPLARALLELPPVGTPFAALCRGESAAEATRRLAQLGPGGRARFETALRGGGGRALPAEVTAVAARAGEERGILLAVRDLDQLRSVEETYRVVVEASPDPISLSRLDDGVMVAVNDAFVRLQGRTREEVLGRSSLDFGLWADPDERRAMVERLRREGVVHGVDVHLRSADGGVFVAAFSARRVVVGGVDHVVSLARDIRAAQALEAERARLTARVQSQQESLERILETMQEGVRVADEEGRILFANQRYAELQGVPHGSLVGHRYLEFVPPENVPIASAMLAEVMRGARVRREVRSPSLDGRVRWLLNSVSPLHDAKGRIVGSVGVLTDLTERQEALDRLAMEKERLAVTLQSIGDAVIATDPEGRVTILNAAAEQLTGFSAGEAVGRPLEEVFRIVDESTRQRMESPLRRVVRAGARTGLSGPALLLARDGRERSIADSGAPIRGADGAALGMVLVFRDQTEERRAAAAMQEAQEAVRQSERRFRALIENSTDVIIVFDAEKRIQFWSPSAFQLLGWRAEELLGRPLQEVHLIHPDDLAGLAEATQRIAGRPGDTAVLRARHLHRDGTWRLLEGTGRNLLHDPVVRGVVVNARDVTEQHRLEEQLRQTQKLDSIGRLAGGVAHDFNNILTVILASVETLRDELLAAASGPGAMADLEQIRSAGTRARDLTQHLLAFARKQVFAPVRLDLNEVVGTAEKLLRRVLGEDVRLLLELEQAPWPVLCDPNQVERALMNLVVNARDAMPSGGTLTLRTRNLTAGDPEAEAGDQVCLAVSDTGVGIPPEIRAHLFEPFFTTKEPGKGTGLGLATVYGIVVQSGGTVRVESEPGRGTTVELRFPRASGGGEPARAVAPSPVGQRTGVECLLVAEDDPHVRAVTVRTLQGAGYRLLVAGSGPEALERVRSWAEPIDLVVTDVIMPGMSGRALVEALRQKNPGLRALYLSGYSQDAIARHGVLDEGTEFLAKPFTPGVLLERVRAALDRRA